MKYAEFVNVLGQNAGKELVFEFEHGQIRKDYHITEVLNTMVQAIDCGGAIDTWRESVLQLLEPHSEDGERFMAASKALGILNQSSAKIELSGEANLILEFRPEGVAAAQRYNVLEVEVGEKQLVVYAGGSTTQCKAAERSNESCGPKPASTKAGGACCGPAKSPSVQKSACCG